VEVGFLSSKNSLQDGERRKAWDSEAAQSCQPHTGQHIQVGVLTQMDIHTAWMASTRQQVLTDSRVLKNTIIWNQYPSILHCETQKQRFFQ